MEQPTFLLTLAGALGAAFAMGMLVQRAGISPIVGYLAAGILVGPHTPGFVADQKFATEAEAAATHPPPAPAKADGSNT